MNGHQTVNGVEGTVDEEEEELGDDEIWIAFDNVRHVGGVVGRERVVCDVRILGVCAGRGGRFYS